MLQQGGRDVLVLECRSRFPERPSSEGRPGAAVDFNSVQHITKLDNFATDPMNDTLQ